MTTLPAALFRDGVLLRREALELGISDKVLHGAVKSGVLVRIRQGAYAERAAWLHLRPDDRHRALTAGVARLYGTDVVLSHASGIVDHSGPTYGLDLSCVHITHPDGTGRTQGSVHHHCGPLRADDLIRADGRRVTSIARSVVQTTMHEGSVEVGIVLASHFLHEKELTPDDLEAARLDVGAAPGALILRAALAYSRPELASVAESRCWYTLCRSDLPTVIPQHPIHDRRGTVLAYTDFAIPELGVFVEVDGKEKYLKHRRPGESLEDFLIRERRRENLICELTGWSVIRFTWADLARPDQIVRRIRAVAQQRRRDAQARTN